MKQHICRGGGGGGGVISSATKDFRELGDGDYLNTKMTDSTVEELKLSFWKKFVTDFNGARVLKICIFFVYWRIWSKQKPIDSSFNVLSKVFWNQSYAIKNLGGRNILKCKSQLIDVQLSRRLM